MFVLLGCDKEEKKSVPKVLESLSKDTFFLEDTKGLVHSLTLSKGKLLFHKSTQGIVLVHIFATWCNPCEGMVASLSDIHKKYTKDVFVVAVPTHDLADKKEINTFINDAKAEYFISYAKDNEDFVSLVIASLAKEIDLDKNYAIPLTIMYVEGNYFTHYEGLVPMEMIVYDIKQAQKQFQ